MWTTDKNNKLTILPARYTVGIQSLQLVMHKHRFVKNENHKNN